VKREKRDSGFGLPESGFGIRESGNQERIKKSLN
jgi:hypothetical protein